jgi:hypothetical protein
VHFDSGNTDKAHSSWQQAVYIAAGSDPFALVDASVAAAAAIAGMSPWVQLQCNGRHTFGMYTFAPLPACTPTGYHHQFSPAM